MFVALEEQTVLLFPGLACENQQSVRFPLLGALDPFGGFEPPSRNQMGSASSKPPTHQAPNHYLPRGSEGLHICGFGFGSRGFATDSSNPQI